MSGPRGVTQEELNHRFTHHPPKNDRDVRFYQAFRDIGLQVAEYLVEHTAPSYEQSVALTKIEEAVMWGNAARARHVGPELFTTSILGATDDEFVPEVVGGDDGALDAALEEDESYEAD